MWHGSECGMALNVANLGSSPFLPGFKLSHTILDVIDYRGCHTVSHSSGLVTDRHR